MIKNIKAFLYANWGWIKAYFVLIVFFSCAALLSVFLES